MPTYQYACTSCGERLEVVQKFTDDPLTVCPSCQGTLRKVFSAVGVVFKGSGFYKTDSRAKTSGGSAPKTDSPAETPAASGKDSGGKGSGDAKPVTPAASPAPESKPAASSSGDRVA